MNLRACYWTISVACLVWICCQILSGVQNVTVQQISTSTEGNASTLTQCGQHTECRSGGGSHNDSSQSTGSPRSNRTSKRAQQLLDWLAKVNTVANVDLEYAGAGRGHVLLAKRAMVRGDILAAIPAEAWWIVDQHGARGSLEFGALNLLAELTNPQSFWRPWFEAMPTPDELLCPLVHMPPDYLALLQSAPLEKYVQEYQARVEGFWRHVNLSNEGTVSLGQFKHARSILLTRMFGTARHGNILAPLIDMANHVHDCPHFHIEKPCPQDPSRRCIVWMAGTYLPPGADVCHSYKYMPNDKSMLQYGFLQDGPMSNHLHLLDLPTFDGNNIWSLYEYSQHGPPLFEGTIEELQQEADRLTRILSEISLGDGRAAATQASTADPGGKLLEMLLKWRQQRKQTLRREADRLQRQIVQLTAGKPLLLTSRSGGILTEQLALEQSPEAADTLFEWVTQNGGVVHNVRMGMQPSNCIHKRVADSSSRAQPGHALRPGLTTAAPVNAGQVLVSVPLQLTVSLRPEKLKKDIKLWLKDFQHPRSPRSPYYATLFGTNAAGAAACDDYDASLQEDRLPLGQQHGESSAVVRRSRTLKGHTISTDQILQTMSLIQDRLVHLPQGSFLVPIIDVAHSNTECSSTLELTDCSLLTNSESANSAHGSRENFLSSTAKVASSTNSRNDSPRLVSTAEWCVVLQAGEDLASGDAVCIPAAHKSPAQPALLNSD